MARCEVEGCDFITEAMSTYEDAHKVMTRHLTWHLIAALQNLRPQEAHHAPEAPSPEVSLGSGPNGPLPPVSEPGNGPQVRRVAAIPEKGTT